MSIGPILPGRIPDTFSALQTERNLRTAQGELSRLQRQIATGQRFFLPGEDPGAAAVTVKLQSELERRTQSQRNVEADRSLLGATDVALADLGDTLLAARTISLAAIGESSTPAETQQFAAEIEAMLTSALQTANTSFRGRHLFGGTQTLDEPFAILTEGVRFTGDHRTIGSRPDFDLLMANNLEPTAAFGLEAAVSSIDLNPSATAATRLDRLNGGSGVREVDALRVTVGGVATDVDLIGARTLGDIETRLEAAFAASPTTLDVTITATGLDLTPSAGTVQVENVDGSRLATDLGLVGPAAAVLSSGDLDPTLDELDPVASLFGGVVPLSIADGVQVTVGNQTAVVDIAAAATVEDVINEFRQAGLNLDARIGADGKSLEVISRDSGAAFAIGENGGTLAADLGLRTLTAATRLDDLNDGLGVPIFPGADPGTLVRDLDIVRRDGTEIAIDLSTAETIQDVLDAINAVDPGVLNATLRADGNGLAVEDLQVVVLPTVAVPFEIKQEAVSEALGIFGSEATGLAPIEGDDTNPQRSGGLFSLMWQLREALINADDRHIGRVSDLMEDEIGRLNAVRGEVGNRINVLAETETRLSDASLRIQESIGEVFDADLTETITSLYSVQAAYQASLQVSANLLGTNLIQFL